MTRSRVIGALVLGLLAACATAPESAGPGNAVAAYIHVSADRFVQDSVIEPLSRAAPGEPSSPAGFVPGLRLAGSQRAADGVYGWEFIFQADVTEEQSRNFLGRAEQLDLTVIWLGPDEYWPWCEGEPRCQMVKESGDFP